MFIGCLWLGCFNLHDKKTRVGFVYDNNKYLAATSLGSAPKMICFIVGDTNTFLNSLFLAHKILWLLLTRDEGCGL